VIEHTTNPIKALTEWGRVLKSDGVLVLIVPHKEGTFDHKRPVSTLEHLVDDFERSMTEEDLSHLDEILKFHDLKKDPEAGGFEDFKKRSEKNYENRCLHHHVFDTELVVSLLHEMNYQLHAVEVMLPYHIIVIAQKLKPGEEIVNNKYYDGNPEYKRLSPFSADRLS